MVWCCGRWCQRLLLLGQALFIVPAGKVAVITTLGKVSGGFVARAELKIPFVQSVYPFDAYPGATKSLQHSPRICGH